jgi:hypothetical protein
VKLDDFLDSFQQVLDHPRHRAAQETLVKLIRQLRACADVDEGYEFQQALLAQVLAVEEDHHAFRRVSRHRHMLLPRPGRQVRATAAACPDLRTCRARRPR